MSDSEWTDLRKSRMSRQIIRESFSTAAVKRGSIELRIQNGPMKQTLQVNERLSNGDQKIVVVTYDGEMISEQLLTHDRHGLRELSRKPIRKSPLYDSMFYLKRIVDIWYSGPSNYFARGWDKEALEHEPQIVEQWELPSRPLKVFRLNHDNLLISCCDSDALQFTMMARRKTVRVTEVVPTVGKRGLHTREEIISETLNQVASGHTSQANADRGLERLDRCLKQYRRYLL